MKKNNIYVGHLISVEGEKIKIKDDTEEYSLGVSEKCKSLLSADPSRDTMVIAMTNRDGIIVGFRYYSGHYDVLEEIPSKDDPEKKIKVKTHILLGRVVRVEPVEGTNRCRLSMAIGSGENTEWCNLTAWDALAERAALELAVPEGEKKPVAIVTATQQTYKKSNGEEGVSYKMLTFKAV